MVQTVRSDSPTTAPVARRIFFANLNGLRFLAAFAVVIDHIEGFRNSVGVYNHWQNPALPMLGQLGVTLFFVLSGFLITYLLLAEKEQFGRINFRDFYVRRTLRIWPLYYVVVLLALFVLPHISWMSYPGQTEHATEHLGGKLLFYCLMLPNIARELYLPVPYLAQAWSIGVEEQFYLLWPWVIHYGRRYALLLTGLALAFAVALQLPWFVTAPGREWITNTPTLDVLKNILSALRMQSMCIGGLCAVPLYFRQSAVLRLLRSVPVQVGVWLLVPILAWDGRWLGPFTFELYSLLFGVLILNLADERHSLVALRGPVLSYLGKISYGLYMLHGLGMPIGLLAAQALTPDSASLLHQGTMTFVTTAIAIGLAMLSYHFLEKPFLKYKKAFVKVKSGDEV